MARSAPSSAAASEPLGADSHDAPTQWHGAVAWTAADFPAPDVSAHIVAARLSATTRHAGTEYASGSFSVVSQHAAAAAGCALGDTTGRPSAGQSNGRPGTARHPGAAGIQARYTTFLSAATLGFWSAGAAGSTTSRAEFSTAAAAAQATSTGWTRRCASDQGDCSGPDIVSGAAEYTEAANSAASVCGATRGGNQGSAEVACPANAAGR